MTVRVPLARVLARAAFAALLLAGVPVGPSVAAARAADDVKSVWPPTGPVWETDPAAAFERARKEEKGVLVYVATEACPHCKVMAREVWPKPEVAEASRSTVFLAVYRWGKSAGATGGGAAETTDSEWAQRLDVMAYPQLRLLDASGRTLAGGARFTFARTPADVVAAAKQANDEARRADTHAAPGFPASLTAKLTKDEQKTVQSPVGAVRAEAWKALLARGGLDRAALLDLWRAEDDPVVRIAAAEALSRGKADAATVKELRSGVEGDHDYVRRACLRGLAAVGGKDAADALGAAVAAAVAPTAAAKFRNPNNVLCDALDACLKAADPSHVEVLGRVVERREGNNYATVLAVRTLVAIGKSAGWEKVRKPLEVARTIEGPHAKTIRDLVEKSLGK